MVDHELLAAMQDVASFRRFVEDRLVDAMRSTIWGIPVIEDASLPDCIEIRCGTGRARQDCEIVEEDGRLIVRVIGEPYDA